jgi:hypothetical protein
MRNPALRQSVHAARGDQLESPSWPTRTSRKATIRIRGRNSRIPAGQAADPAPSSLRVLDLAPQFWRRRSVPPLFLS